MNLTSIEWTERTWNPTKGCTRKSEGCRYCYAEVMAGRFSGPGLHAEGFARRTRDGFRWTGRVELIESKLEEPARIRKPSLFFVNSMSDLFHEKLSLAAIGRVFKVMAECPQHTFQILTKRSERLVELAPHLPWPSNVWMGVSVENQEVAYRVDNLRKVPAAVRFISAEPLIGPLTLNLEGIHWLIAGGESGPKARPMDLDWARSLRDQCITAGVKFFLKQLGGRGAQGKRGGEEAVLDGQRWTERPEVKK